MTTISPTPAAGQRDTGMLDLMIVLARRKKMLTLVPLAAATFAAGISLALPDIYKASARILPPQQSQSGAAALLSQLGSVAGAAAGATAGLKNPADLYVGLLKSRTIADRLVTGYGLDKVYEADSREDARKALADASTFTAGKDGLITVDVLDKERKRAAALANAYLAELSKLTTVLAVTEAAQRRLFFERQLETAKNNLARAEVALKGALDTRGVISVDTESRAVLETMARLRAQISAKEIQLASLGTFVTENNQDYRRTQAELNSLRAELSRFENGHGNQAPAADGPARSGLNSVQILRDVKYYQMLYELLAKQYELARLDEAKDASVIQVVDAAIEPERKVKPARALIVLLTATVALVAALALAFMLEAKESLLRQEAGRARWQELRSHLGWRKARGLSAEHVVIDEVARNER